MLVDATLPPLLEDPNEARKIQKKEENERRRAGFKFESCSCRLIRLVRLKKEVCLS